MSHTMRGLLFWAFVAAACSFALGDTPVSKVVELLENLLDEVQREGVTEATTYDEFACFCKTTTDSKSSDIKGSRDTINTKSSTIAEKTATKEEKQDELRKRQKNHETMSAELTQTETAYAKAKSEYQIKEADLAKAINSLGNAMTSLESAKPEQSFLAVREKVQQGIALAGVLNLIAEPKRKVLEAFLQTRSAVDPQDPVFKYHSQGIIDVLDKLMIDFRDEKKEVDEEFGKTTRTFQDTKDSLENKISANSDAIATLAGTTIPNLQGEIASARADLVAQEATLKDEQAYLKDLTEVCEARANDWDQRSALRADEIRNLDGALVVLRRDVVDADNETNKRALLIERSSSHLVDVAAHAVGPSLLQEIVSRRETGVSSNFDALAYKAKQAQASALLRRESARLHSTALASIAVHLEADPFDKVKTLIQRLIERLLKESTAEATKKGFCDTQLGKARKDREYSLIDTQDLNLEIKGLELKEDELVTEIQMLQDSLVKLRDTLATATQDRQIEHAQNIQTIKTAKGGLAGVQEAITILKVFYKQAAKATVLLQASPLVEDTSGPGFAGAYKGRQESSKGIIGMLEVIESDFDRTVRVTESAEQEAHADFVKLERALKADISGNEEKKMLDEEDLTTTRDTMNTKMADLQTAQDRLDTALGVLETLKPVCIDTGMSYADRVATREEEIEALRRAWCILHPDPENKSGKYDDDDDVGNCGGGGGGGQTLQ